MRDISDDEQRSDRAKSTLPTGLRRRPVIASLRLLNDVPHRRRRRASLWPGGARNAAHGTSTTGC
jgi:hypothetical protein